MVGLLIVTFTSGNIPKQVNGQFHRTDYFFDKFDLTRRDAVFGVQVFVRPLLCPLLCRHEGVHLARGVLRRFMQKNQKTRQPAGQVRQGTFGLALTVERADAEIRFRTNTARLANEGRAENAVRVCITVAGARCGTTHINLPLVDEFGASGYRVSRDICHTSVLINSYVTLTFFGISTKKSTKAERPERANKLIKSLTLKQF